MNAAVAEVIEAVAGEQPPMRRVTIDIEFAELKALPLLEPDPQLPLKLDVTVAPYTGPRFVKCDGNGNVLPADATSWPCVLDRELGLVWIVETFGGDDGLPHAKACDLARAVETGGHKDWRLPTIRELLTLVDYERKDPAIDVALFPGTRSAWYWTSTAWAGSPGSYAWYVNFNGGDADDAHRDDLGFVRAVRSVARASAGQ